MSNQHSYEHAYADYSATTEEYGARQSGGPSASKARRPQQGRRRGKAPQSINGIHRRRRRKLAW